MKATATWLDASLDCQRVCRQQSRSSGRSRRGSSRLYNAMEGSPISTKPRPRPSSGSIACASLSNPAASPVLGTLQLFDTANAVHRRASQLRKPNVQGPSPCPGIAYPTERMQRVSHVNAAVAAIVYQTAHTKYGCSAGAASFPGSLPLSQACM